MSVRSEIKLLPVVLICLCFSLKFSYAQTTIRGKITGEQGRSIPGANVYLKNTYDGTSCSADGSFSFTTKKTGQAILVVNYISYETYEQAIELKGDDIEINIKLEVSITRIDAVTISAGMFEAGDEKKSVILNSLDIVTTAGSGADIVSALTTLPGASMVGGQTGLYVRGGESREAQTFIDGMRVAHPFFSSVPDISQRGRFSPFLFQGTYFSTGGYSAEYGQGLSSALILNTEGLPSESYTSISLMTLGAGAGHNHLWDKTSLGVFANYTNLNPYTYLVKQNIDWTNSATGYDASVIFRQKTSKTGMLKAYIQYDKGDVGFYRDDMLNYPEQVHFKILGSNLYSNLSYKEQLAEKLIFSSGLSYSYNNDDIENGDNNLIIIDKAGIAKAKLKYLLGDLSSVKLGGEMQYMNFEDSVTQTENYYATFAEGDFYLTKKLVIRLGLRGEYSKLVNKYNMAPRASLAYKTGNYGQFSLAYGRFYQAPEREYLYNTDLNNYEQATHYIFNYQLIGDERSFRIESYYKKYDNLLLYGREFSTDGFGDAKGLDVFWRDKKTIPNADYWISYSYLDTKRKYLYYPVEAMPDYASKHHLSIVYKHFVKFLSSNIGATYVFSSGRPYYNPNNANFMSDITGACHNISLNMSWIRAIGKKFIVVSVSVSNVLGSDNIYGYHYTPDGSQRVAVTDASKRFYFLGVFISIGRDNTEDI
ncbi:MAG: TonB-dependent receptor [Bacteroidales bacterium]|nr:TonB-dependent receptor [Bacteroidales bacterium]